MFVFEDATVPQRAGCIPSLSFQRRFPPETVAESRPTTVWFALILRYEADSVAKRKGRTMKRKMKMLAGAAIVILAFAPFL